MEFDYTVKFNMKDDGYDADVKAPGPVTMKSKWSVREVEGGVEVTEDVEATVSRHSRFIFWVSTFLLWEAVGCFMKFKF